MAEQKEKHVMMSKTLWVNLIMAVVAIIATKAPGVEDVMTAENVGMLFGFINVILRMVSKDKIYFKK